MPSNWKPEDIHHAMATFNALVDDVREMGDEIVSLKAQLVAKEREVEYWKKLVNDIDDKIGVALERHC